ncbi:GGDEF domain-containing protein [Clostridium beijerinckii]|uniref:Diguanylate cyclase (GGDEF)-like protein n=3 Tax=Clostridium beijerinckii TaxID=1520 RepID=A0A9Q5CW34_CLOBE|nr:GGDEF domain-containing protein [Clostridium beijerinckii]AQS05518.1 putative diguanylate cyclase YdaM [Clostridium beijerinckii]MBA2884979.1 diguanylate cyclase (GGDEF)-like protein [Clostridium beijerinckii]MBA2899647.1 diguanylate cyclase (GGDEF)-like protein [Clostridium beijerinckii]MBA2909330.1 diguanylate cyclase (GGDEF)-like protein [Clostridium beijerinckii]MBA9014903.1 diguanylate cyclase (GGDEF)-like protein [Clostridium beijerinckii]
MNKLYFLKKLDLNLTEDQKATVINDINVTNLERMKLILIIFIIVEILFILFNDIPYLINHSSNVIWNDSKYFILHSLNVIVSFVGLILIKVLTKYSKDKFRVMNKLLIPTLTILILSSMAMINALDQAKPGNVSSVFIANLIIFSSIIMLRAPLNLAVYSIPFLAYLSGLVIFQNDINLLVTNIINGLIFFLAIIIISTGIYNSNYEKIAQNIILREINTKLNYISSHDSLTKLLNRRSFSNHVSEKMRIVGKTKKIATLILIDVDHFKHVNDKFGHAVGDMVLKEVSNIIIKHIKTTDLATRWGGEEFLIFLFESSINEAYVLAENIRQEIQNKVIVTDKFQIQITASFGISLLKDNFSKSFDTSFKSADVALYKAKNQGRNRIVIAS